MISKIMFVVVPVLWVFLVTQWTKHNRLANKAEDLKTYFYHNKRRHIYQFLAAPVGVGLGLVLAQLVNQY